MASEAATERARRIAEEMRQRWCERDALADQAEELKRDAERWRHIQSREIVLIINGVPCRGAELDSAIDDEIRSSKPNGKSGSTGEV